ncbi:PREDICTED: interferon-inducible GTPase 5 [Myotis davidii]|uniref:interferon-inducible GTPase 5 n=1 Tax=Myotis davidii TaxID=225400 RepID=UPI0003EC50BD|nr:PREDICTED: interferon-inducible GTPase 5 [Myotis davidii]
MATSKCPGEEETTILMAKEELEALRTAFESGDIPQAASRLRELLASSESTGLEVGVTGESGAGKSSLINALRGLGAEDPGAALTGVVETTMQPSSYPHPQFPDVTLARLASEILRQGKKFYFVRTKVDEDLAATRSQRPSGFSESMVLQEIRDHCTERLRAAGVSDPRIFLVSNLWPVRYDFPLLLSTWEHDLPAHRRHAGLLSLPDISLEALQRKKDMLQEQVLKTALVSGVIQALPVPGLAAAYDDALLIRSLRGYHRSFGLDEDSGTLVAGGISFGTVYTMLQGCLNEMAEDAQRVRIKALEEEEESQPEVSLDAAGDNVVEKCGVGEGGGEEAPLSTRRKLGLLLKYILDSWKKRDLEDK